MPAKSIRENCPLQKKNGKKLEAPISEMKHYKASPKYLSVKENTLEWHVFFRIPIVSFIDCGISRYRGVYLTI